MEYREETSEDSRWGQAPDSSAEENRKPSLTTQVYETLLNKLINNELVPGHVLNRRTVAKELGVSVAPVLEAFLQLSMEGFVEVIPRKGTIVKPIRKEDIYDQLIMREALECQASRMYCGEPVEATLDKLEPLAERLDEAIALDVEHWQYEIDFHGLLVSLSRSRALTNEFHRVVRLGTFYNMHRVVSDLRRAGEVFDNQSHVELLKKLVSQDPDFVEGIIRDHLRSGKRTLFTHFRPIEHN
ncbi:MAG TPA: GntR family transcriptional regulator [Spirochaetia bacterium]|nr:GntR family transcriptional regulator [Spirochaetia bacterium]